MTIETPKTKPADGTRRAQLAALHIAQKNLRLSDDDARALKIAITGKSSASDMTASQIRQYLAHLSDLQARAAIGRGEKPAYQRPRPALVRNIDDDQDKQWAKARVLWAELHTAGHVRVNTDAALQSYATRQTGVDAWRFCNQRQMTNVIEALKKWCRRVGVAIN